MWYKETHTPENFLQGLKIGDTAIFYRSGDKYTADGWERIEIQVEIVGYGYPFILTNKGGFHYSRFVKKVKVSKQLKMF